jgi:hypothetical protein
MFLDARPAGADKGGGQQMFDDFSPQHPEGSLQIPTKW